MVNWIEQLYTAALKLGLAPEIVNNIEVLPDLLSEHLPILTRYGYTDPLVRVIQYDTASVLRIDYNNHLLGRTFVLFFNITEPYPPIWIWVIRTEPRYETTYIEKYFIKKSNGKISYENFKLSSYPGDVKEKVKGFCEFLTGQFRIRGLFWLDGTSWLESYGMDI